MGALRGRSPTNGNAVLLRTTAFPIVLFTVMPTSEVGSSASEITAVNGETLASKRDAPPDAPVQNPLDGEDWPTAASDGEAMASLLPAAREYFTARLGAHAFQKSVYALTPAIVRLIQSHFMTSSVIESCPHPLWQTSP